LLHENYFLREICINRSGIFFRSKLKKPEQDAKNIDEKAEFTGKHFSDESDRCPLMQGG
jgi:hypothetical protein